MNYKKLANDYVNKQIYLGKQGNEFFYFYPNKAYNRTYISEKNLNKLKLSVQRLNIKKQLNDDQPIKKYSVHLALWGKEGYREKYNGMIMKRREETVTMKLSDTQKTQLQSMGETNENIGNYEGIIY